METELIRQIREVLVEYCKSSVYNIESNKENRIWVANIYMAVSFVGIRPVSRPINFKRRGILFFRKLLRKPVCL